MSTCEVDRWKDEQVELVGCICWRLMVGRATERAMGEVMGGWAGGG